MPIASAVNSPMRMSLWWSAVWSWSPGARSAAPGITLPSGTGADGSCSGAVSASAWVSCGFSPAGMSVSITKMIAMPPKKASVLTQ